jgi:la-related protein 1
MDTEGWISIAMIASFNRIKSLTPEVPMVKEMMELSSLLEVQGDHVRIRGEDAKKWVLPDAKQSPFPPSTSESIQVLATPSSESQALDGTASVATASQAGELESLDGAVELLGLPEGMDLGAGFGVDYQHKPGGVADALMKNNSNNASNTPTQAPSSSASVLNGEEESVKPEESTPGTSVVDEGGDEDKAGR